MNSWLSFFLMHSVLLIVSLVGSCHSGVYDQAMYSTAYGYPSMNTYPYSVSYYGQRIIPMNPMPYTYDGTNYPLIRSAGLYLRPYPGYGYHRRASSMEDGVTSSDDQHQLQTTNEPYKISLMTDNVQQMMNNGQKEVLSMMSTGDDNGSRLARILVKRRREAQGGTTDAGLSAAPDMLSRGLETLTSWYRDTNPTSAPSSTYYPQSSTSNTGAAPDVWSRGVESLSSWYRDANPSPQVSPSYYPQSSATQSNLYPTLLSAPSPYVQPMSYNPPPTGMINVNPMSGGGYASSPAYGYNNNNNMNYPPSNYGHPPPQYSSSKQSSSSLMDTVITALPEITKLTTAVAPYVIGRPSREADQDTGHVLASNRIVSPYITKKGHLQQQQADTSDDDKSRFIQQRYAFSDVPYNTMSSYVTDGDSSDQTVRTSWSPYQNIYSRVDGDTDKAFDSPYAYYTVYAADSTKSADDSSNQRMMYKDSGLDFNYGSSNYGDDSTMAYGDNEDQNRLYSQYYSLQ